MSVFPFNLFAKNPFTPLREHMQKSLECVEGTKGLFEALYAGDKDGVRDHSRRISQLEHEADIVKHEIRSRLTTSIFLPVDRRDVLALLSSMDAVADNAEDIGVLLSMRWMDVPSWLKGPIDELRRRVYRVVERSADVINSFDALLEAGFQGPDADNVIAIVDEVSRLEHEADKAQDVCGKALFAHEDELKAAELFMWIKIVNKVGDIANAAERMVNLTRIMVAR
jgi:uncharacterized protein